MHQCKNCAENFEGNYCNNCSQKATVGRLHMHDIWHEIWHAFTHSDKGIIKLIKDLIFHPVSTYPKYFSGKRKSYFSPFLFYLLTAGLAIFIGDKIFAYEDSINQMNNEMGKFILDNNKLLDLFILPVEALLTWAIFHKRFNFAECIVFWLFCNGLVFTFRISMTPIYLLLIHHKSMVDYCVGIACFIIIFWQVVAVFAWKQTWVTYMICFLLINVIIILSQYAGYYLLFDNDVFHQSFWRMVLQAYT